MRQYSTTTQVEQVPSQPSVLLLREVPGAEPYRCKPGETILQAVRRSHPKHPMLGCANGGCGLCRIQVLSGEYECGLMSAAQVSAADRDEGIVLACRALPCSDLSFRYLGKPNH